MSVKKKIYVVVLIWAAVFVQIVITKKIDRESEMVAQVLSDGVENVTAAEIKLYAHYSNEELTDAMRRKMLIHIGETLGITSGYEVTEKQGDENTSTVYRKQGANADTTIRLITMEQTEADGEAVQENYLMTEVSLKNQSMESISACKEELENLYEDLGLDASSNLYLCSQEKGRMTEDEMQAATEEFFTTMRAETRKTITLSDTLCIYGYSENVPDYVYQDDERVNVNIAFSYDETEDITYIHRALPFIDKSF